MNHKTNQNPEGILRNQALRTQGWTGRHASQFQLSRAAAENLTSTGAKLTSPLVQIHSCLTCLCDVTPRGKREHEEDNTHKTPQAKANNGWHRGAHTVSQHVV